MADRYWSTEQQRWVYPGEVDLPPLPEPDVPAGDHHESDPAWFTAVQMREYARAAVLQERERWVQGARVSIPTDTMEQEFAAHFRRGVLAERERCARVCEAQYEPHNDSYHDCAVQQCVDAIRKGIE